MRKILLFFVVIYCLSGCAAKNKFTTWQRHSFEKGSYVDALDVFDSAIPTKILDECGYIFNAPIPPTISVKSLEELKQLHGINSEVKGFYRKSTKEVYYLKGEFDTLMHEYFHYLNDISKKNDVCYDQIIAYFGVWGHKQRKAARKWRKAFKKEHTRNRGR